MHPRDPLGIRAFDPTSTPWWHVPRLAGGYDPPHPQSHRGIIGGVKGPILHPRPLGPVSVVPSPSVIGLDRGPRFGRFGHVAVETLEALGVCYVVPPSETSFEAEDLDGLFRIVGAVHDAVERAKRIPLAV